MSSKVGATVYGVASVFLHKLSNRRALIVTVFKQQPPTWIEMLAGTGSNNTNGIETLGTRDQGRAWLEAHIA